MKNNLWRILAAILENQSEHVKEKIIILEDPPMTNNSICLLVKRSDVSPLIPTEVLNILREFIDIRTFWITEIRSNFKSETLKKDYLYVELSPNGFMDTTRSMEEGIRLTKESLLRNEFKGVNRLLFKDCYPI